MNLWTKAKLLKGIIRWRLTWDKRNTHFRYSVPGNPKFMGPRDAVALIQDGDTVAVSGLGGNQHATILYWSIRELFEETQHPCDLTVLSIGEQGGRGKPKFVESVDEITFAGREALKAARTVFYVTSVGAFRLTEKGLELHSAMPGVDIQKDILEFSGAPIHLPKLGEVPVVDASVVTGKDFKCVLPSV